MKDFTLKAYRNYLEALQHNGFCFVRFDQFFTSSELPSRMCIVRHDVDRKPKNALRMAVLESEIGIVSSYYFRMKKSSYNLPVMKEIFMLNHEIGYHYETLSDTGGNKERAFELFIENLNLFRKNFPIKTISMHGKPFSPYDNRALWIDERYGKLKKELNILGELYLDIDYSDIAYINDTGRNWTSSKSNRRDKVNSGIKTEFANSNDLLSYLREKPHSKIIFQIHPERWNDKIIDWAVQFSKDHIINLMKHVLAKS